MGCCHNKRFESNMENYQGTTHSSSYSLVDHTRKVMLQQIVKLQQNELSLKSKIDEFLQTSDEKTIEIRKLTESLRISQSYVHLWTKKYTKLHSDWEKVKEKCELMEAFVTQHQLEEARYVKLNDSMDLLVSHVENIEVKFPELLSKLNSQDDQLHEADEAMIQLQLSYQKEIKSLRAQLSAQTGKDRCLKDKCDHFITQLIDQISEASSVIDRPIPIIALSAASLYALRKIFKKLFF